MSGLLALLWAGLLAGLSFLRHARHDTYAHDLGLLAQVVFNNLHGRWYETTLVGGNYLGEHFSPALVLIAPLYLMWADPRVLLLAQAVALAAGGWIVWLGAREQFGHGRGGLAAALPIQIAYYLAPSLAWVARAEFHQIVFAVPTLALAGRSFLAGRAWPAAGWAGLALLANEDAALAVAGFALALLVTRRLRAGALLLVVALAWLSGYLFLIAPAVRAQSALAAVPPTAFGAFADLGTTREAVIGAIVGDPLSFLGRAIGPGRPAAWLAVLGPTAGLALFSPLALSWLPTFALIVLGASPERYQMHYVAPVLPLASLAAVDAIGRLRRRLGRTALGLAGLVLIATLAVAAWGSPLPGGGAYRPDWYARTPHDEVIDRALALIPHDPEIAVSASTELVAHLALRRQIWLFPGLPPNPDYLIVDTQGSPYPLPSGEEFRRQVAIARSNPAFQTIFDEDSVLVLARRPDPPATPLALDFGDQIRLADYQLDRPSPEQLRLSLTWQALRRPDRDYTRFVHVFAPDGRRIAQLDSQPLENRFPTSQWSPGRLVQEDLALTLPAESSALRIVVGWYDLQTLERLRRPDGSSEATLD